MKHYGVIHANGDKEFVSADGTVLLLVSKSGSVTMKCGGHHRLTGDGDTFRLDGEAIGWLPEGVYYEDARTLFAELAERKPEVTDTVPDWSRRLYVLVLSLMAATGGFHFARETYGWSLIMSTFVVLCLWFGTRKGAPLDDRRNP